MRILYVHRTQGVGAEGAHIMGMCEAFRELGHTVEMQCIPGCNPFEQSAAPAREKPKPSLIKRVYWLVAEHIPQFLFEGLELGYNAVLAFRFLKHARAFKPDMVYERYSLNTFASCLLSRRMGIPHVLEVNDSVVIERSRPLVFKSVAAFWEGRCLKATRLAITITEQFRSNLAARFGVDKGKILVLTNAVSKPRFSRDFGREAARKREGLDGFTVIGSTGQFLDWHGLKELVEKMGPVARERGLFFLFIGDGPSRENVMAKAGELGIEDRVRFTGMLPVSEVPSRLALLDMAVIPNAAKHASPMKLMEYMAMGLPIVAPELPSIRAALAVEGLGRIFPEGSMEAMKADITALLDDKAAAAAMGRRARDYVFEHLTWTGHAEEVLRHPAMR